MADFIMPSLGADMKEGILVAWRVSEGDRINKGDIVAEIETQKGIFEVEAYHDGVIGPLLKQPGNQRIPVGTRLTTISDSGTPSRGETAQAREQKPAERIKISPLARRLAQQHGIDLNRLRGSGPVGEIVQRDIDQLLQQQKSGTAPVATDPVKETAGEAFKDGMRQAVAAAMSLSNREIPHYYLASDIDFNRCQQWLEEQNRQRPISQRLLPIALLLKATALALKKTPQLNGYWIDDQLQPQAAINIGLAISLRGGGLVTPALMGCDHLSVAQLMAGCSDLIERARRGTLRGSEMTAATVTLTSLGERGVNQIYGLIYPPQVALIGFGSPSERPWATNGVVSARPVISASLAADHRASDGHLGAQFLARINQLLQQPEAL